MRLPTARPAARTGPARERAATAGVRPGEEVVAVAGPVILPAKSPHPEEAPVTPRSRALARRLAVLAALLAGAVAAAEDGPPPLRCGTGVHGQEAEGFVGFPQGDVFCPLVADPKAMRSFVSYQRGEFPEVIGATDVGAVGIADGFGLVRVGGPRPGEGLQLGVEAGVFAQFDLGAASDLVNADYLVGFPLTARFGAFSGRVRVFHQSSHLGDEFLGRTEIVREELSFEAVDAIASVELGALRLYGGAEYLFSRTPAALDPYVLQGGAEVRVGPVRGARLVAAADVKSSEQRAWDPAWSAKAGVEYAHWSSPDHPPRVFSILGEYYDGPSPYGQFYLEETRFYGVGFHFQR